MSGNWKNVGSTADKAVRFLLSAIHGAKSDPLEGAFCTQTERRWEAFEVDGGRVRRAVGDIEA